MEALLENGAVAHSRASKCVSQQRGVTKHHICSGQNVNFMFMLFVKTISKCITQSIDNVPTRTVLPPLTRTPEKQSNFPPPRHPPVLSVEGEGALNVAPIMRPVSPQTRQALYQDSSHHVRIIVV